MNLQDIIYHYVSKHEIYISDKFKNREPRFTIFGSIVSNNIISEILETLDETNKNKVIELMKNKSV